MRLDGIHHRLIIGITVAFKPMMLTNGEFSGFERLPAFDGTKGMMKKGKVGVKPRLLNPFNASVIVIYS